ncbi:L-sorbosone dehydrogenase [Lachnellula subtilissima]|uniref:L-sorbosone dehydrogenase n=1 Tax=Lachnellula subtilissima TaxID=602034 RepID=A0A8H8REX6_9HELO|nr:L-sorbosone dehydrogenase [Lachnellula subtilissima]
MQISTRTQTPILFLAVLLPAVSASTEYCSLKPSYPAPVVSNGWSAQLVAQNLTKPRGIIFDSAGNLLVVQQGAGIVHLELIDGGSTCLEVAKKTTLIDSPLVGVLFLSVLTHGIALSTDHRTLYASSSDAVYAWQYDAKAVSVSGDNQTLIDGMSGDDHVTRTLLISQMVSQTLVVSRGSISNIDVEAEDISIGHSQIRAFDLENKTMNSNSTPYDFARQGRILGWGLRNSVGVAEEPLTGGIYSVENSADMIERDNVDIHQNNPGEEMNYHGFLNSSTDKNQGGNYGYPYCFALYNTSIPNLGKLKVGSQFSLDQNSTINDTFCQEEHTAPRLTFQAHMAPLDIKFQPNGTEAYISLHGSWDRDNPTGYKVSSIAFSNGSPVASPDSTNSLTDIMTNPDNSKCPDNCFRPVGLALDSLGRLFMSSDATGEIYVLVKTSTATPTSTSLPASTKSKSGGLRVRSSMVMFLVPGVVNLFSLWLL